MIARRLAAAGALALAALSAPALAQAAPIVPSQAILAAHEFPFGSTSYQLKDETIDFTGAESADDSPCERSLRDAMAAIAGTKAMSAEAKRGTTTISSAIVARSYTDRVAKIDEACDDGAARQQNLAAPPDLARYTSHITTYRGSSIDSWVDVRGVTVSVQVYSSGSNAVDSEAFWQTLRAQVAKVERQP
ncbi:hypothetical protein [Tsukamurella paurometabola]|uniref:PknH-like extracellular domain-containing protein n=1 Tax=Tsukamurella paurometabola (strain ATCC 8368 / DSM 20162 / CCUG 35730 / CIP 100753 / JCM 10117 / KCTC 9821 / NBRC 16120 / NCIMB 702349 / NCTC 13040) TaxID=521096 RepID=D5UMA4_TSUPD|nr:hypothetical protein [Tsukamurella paurometabola]ADG78384.1 hypothetical protein Tpau_1766 [Tsukamurella paurometabola DSM 20162]SUP31434.1 Uncharacterised protein [Tsukamurella paurometabola]